MAMMRVTHQANIVVQGRNPGIPREAIESLSLLDLSSPLLLPSGAVTFGGWGNEEKLGIGGRSQFPDVLTGVSRLRMEANDKIHPH